jgi:AcrR family transcriptional regulator
MDRRARKKAQTRELIRGVAQELFVERGFDAVTIADIAERSDVAVQTVFNHFATKEDLFFDGHTPWVEGPAEAVRSREPDVAPLVALRAYLVGEIGRLVGSYVCPDRRAYARTVNASDALRARELELIHEAERRLSAELLEAWTADDATGGPADPHTAAPLTAAVWLAAARVMVLDQRPRLSGQEAEQAAIATRTFAERLLAQMEMCLQMLHGLPESLPLVDTGWPQPVALRAG